MEQREKKMATHSSIFFFFPLQYSCQENPVDRGAWWAAVHRVAQSRTQLKWLSMHCIGEENGNPLQYSFLENPRDRGTWWAAICGVAQGRTQLKWCSSSSSSMEQSCTSLWRLNCLLLFFIYLFFELSLFKQQSLAYLPVSSSSSFFFFGQVTWHLWS